MTAEPKASDFRSDTVTRPTPEMRRAMAEAAVGDDVFGDDPTVKDLERAAAEMFGKEAALFVPSGTMGNQIAVRVHTRPGDEVIVEERSHTYLYEQGGLAQISHVQARTLPGARGRMEPRAIAAAIRPDDPHFPRTSLVCLENTHNASGGSILPLPYLEEVSALARANGLLLHLDGARIFNASVETGVPLPRYAALFDSVMCCLSKGLAAPIGSLLLGSAPFILAARRARKVLGGGMRQAGVLAAPGLIALQRMQDRLAEDHRRAKDLARRLESVEGVSVVAPETNMVMADLAETAPDEKTVLGRLRERGVMAVPMGPRRIRFVTHKDVDDADVARAAEAFHAAVAAGP